MKRSSMKSAARNSPRLLVPTSTFFGQNPNQRSFEGFIATIQTKSLLWKRTRDAALTITMSGICPRLWLQPSPFRQLGRLQVFLPEGRAYMNVQLFQDGVANINETVRRARLDDDNIARRHFPDFATHEDAPPAFLNEGNLIVLVRVKRSASARLCFD